MHNQYIKSKPCRNCGEWVLEDKKTFHLENKMRSLYAYVKSSNDINEETKEYLLRNLWVR